MAQATETWFSLSPLGYPCWEHTQAFVATTAGGNTLHCELRMVGSNFIVRLFDDGPGLFAAIASHIDRVEALIAKQAA